MKMEPFVVFQDAKGEAPELKKDFKNCFRFQEVSSFGHF